MPNQPVRILYREDDGSVHEGWNITHLIAPEDRARLEEEAEGWFGGLRTIEMVAVDDLDALE